MLVNKTMPYNAYELVVDQKMIQLIPKLQELKSEISFISQLQTSLLIK
jgi:hypothetical protein